MYSEREADGLGAGPAAGESRLLLGTVGDSGLGNLLSGAGEPPRLSTDGDVSPILSTGFFRLSSSSLSAGALPYSRLRAPSKGLAILPRSPASRDLAGLRDEGGRLSAGSLVSRLTLDKRHWR